MKNAKEIMGKGKEVTERLLEDIERVDIKALTNETYIKNSVSVVRSYINSLEEIVMELEEDPMEEKLQEEEKEVGKTRGYKEIAKEKSIRR